MRKGGARVKWYEWAVLIGLGLGGVYLLSRRKKEVKEPEVPTPKLAPTPKALTPSDVIAQELGIPFSHQIAGYSSGAQVFLSALAYYKLRKRKADTAKSPTFKAYEERQARTQATRARLALRTVAQGGSLTKEESDKLKDQFKDTLDGAPKPSIRVHYDRQGNPDYVTADGYYLGTITEASKATIRRSIEDIGGEVPKELL